MHVDVCTDFAFIIGVRFDGPVVRGIGGCERVCVERFEIRCKQGCPAAEPIFTRFAAAIPAGWVVCNVMNVFCQVNRAVAREFLEHSLDAVRGCRICY